MKHSKWALLLIVGLMAVVTACGEKRPCTKGLHVSKALGLCDAPAEHDERLRVEEADGLAQWAEAVENQYVVFKNGQRLRFSEIARFVSKREADKFALENHLFGGRYKWSHGNLSIVSNPRFELGVDPGKHVCLQPPERYNVVRYNKKTSDHKSLCLIPGRETLTFNYRSTINNSSFNSSTHGFAANPAFVCMDFLPHLYATYERITSFSPTGSKTERDVHKVFGDLGWEMIIVDMTKKFVVYHEMRGGGVFRNDNNERSTLTGTGYVNLGFDIQHDLRKCRRGVPNGKN